ncbi:MAG: metal-dependent hydrolase [Pseudomonadales bacterium]
MHPIPVRRLNLEIPAAEEFEPAYMARSAVISYHFTGLGLYVALLEPFIVKSMRRVIGQITDDALREEVDRFCRQEAQHYQQHERFNAVVLAQDYPGLQARVDRLAADFERFLSDRSDRFRIGFVEGFEAYTTQGALEILASRVCDHPRTDPRFGHLFRWHMLEEIEHRNVAFDMYQHLYGGYLYRARMCWVAQSHILRFIRDCTEIMSAADVARHGPQYRVRLIEKVVGGWGRTAKRVRSMLPGYTPHKYQVPKSVAELSAYYSELAVSAT